MENVNLHIAVLPWLAFGHLLPFLELSKRIARHGHRVSFLSTPRNLQRLPKPPPELSTLLHFVELRLPRLESLPENAEATVDLPSDELGPYLKLSFDALDQQLLSFLQNAMPSAPDWIIFDFAAHWVPKMANELSIPCAYLSIFAAATRGFVGPPSALLGGEAARVTPEQFTKPPPWVTFPSTVAFKLHEARKSKGSVPDASGLSVHQRFGKSIDGCDIVAVRSCPEFESEWFQLLEKLYRKPVIPVGLLPPLPPREAGHEEQSYNNGWGDTFRWLDAQKPRSVIFVAFGSEVKLTSSEVHQIAHGLKQSQLPFVWALRVPVDSPDGSAVLPEGFEEQTDGRGLVCKGWVPQAQLLAHPSMGGFLTPVGWSSVIESLALGLPIVLLPMVYDQGLNARSLVEKGISVEVPRKEDDGSFTGEDVAKTLRLVMVEDEGKQYRDKAEKLKALFGDHEMHERYVKEFLKYLCDHKRQKA